MGKKKKKAEGSYSYELNIDKKNVTFHLKADSAKTAKKVGTYLLAMFDKESAKKIK